MHRPDLIRDGQEVRYRLLRPLAPRIAAAETAKPCPAINWVGKASSPPAGSADRSRAQPVLSGLEPPELVGLHPDRLCCLSLWPPSPSRCTNQPGPLSAITRIVSEVLSRLETVRA